MFNKYKRTDNDNCIVVLSIEDVKEEKKKLREISREEYNKIIKERLEKIDDETINHLKKVDLECGSNKAKEYERICKEIKKKKKIKNRKNFFNRLFNL